MTSEKAKRLHSLKVKLIKSLPVLLFIVLAFNPKSFISLAAVLFPGQETQCQIIDLHESRNLRRTRIFPIVTYSCLIDGKEHQASRHIAPLEIFKSLNEKDLIEVKIVKMGPLILTKTKWDDFKDLQFIFIALVFFIIITRVTKKNTIAWANWIHKLAQLREHPKIVDLSHVKSGLIQLSLSLMLYALATSIVLFFEFTRHTGVFLTVGLIFSAVLATIFFFFSVPNLLMRKTWGELEVGSSQRYLAFFLCLFILGALWVFILPRIIT